MPTAGELCTRNVVIVHPSDSLSIVARRMLDAHVGCVVVVRDPAEQDRIPIGILTDRDIVVGVLAHTDRHLNAIHVGDVMSERLVVARETDSIPELAKRMRKAGVRRLPVVGANGALAGIISFDDLFEQLREQLTDLAALLVREREREADLNARPPLTPR
jgi:CBS domain-containing protein